MYYTLRDSAIFYASLWFVKVIQIEATCDLCGKPLEIGEGTLCSSCIAFIEWKYGSLEAYAKTHSKKPEVVPK
ncbi:hypothetical protein COV13_02385 [Candidatus Woesearchaeota archaeon CG10_big_fil_rev_8_21_14_0_10_32_9]|nr:MAG: hypothetical protein COV13_02385 [Candidatus Woesearchaeota archaeon CG10_big_fil_rev_8_21_14_0_10_32_9]